MTSTKTVFSFAMRSLAGPAFAGGVSHNREATRITNLPAKRCMIASQFPVLETRIISQKFQTDPPRAADHFVAAWGRACPGNVGNLLQPRDDGFAPQLRLMLSAASGRSSASRPVGTPRLRLLSCRRAS